VRTAWARAAVRLPPAAALGLWTDVQRWPTFVEGFGHVVERSPEWPAVGARVVWESTPGGRGRVTEKVVESEGDRFATRVFEPALVGTQTLRLAGGEVELTLDYELQRYGPLRALADAIFIRRALRDALRRTLSRFAIEAEEEAGLR
jgi:Polyketide cyclase / dehydrase and lipid transport